MESENGDAGFGYRAFQRALIRTAAELSRLSSAASTASLPALAIGAEERLDHLADGNFVVAVIGAFKRGKSTLTNALLGATIMPADVSPATATLNRVVYGREPRATLMGKGGQTTEVPVDALADYVTKLSETSAAHAENLAEALIEYPTYLCANNVQLLDTPGLDDDETMTAITTGVLSKIDAAIFVTNARAGLDSSELQHLRQLLQHVDLSCVVLAVTYIDQIDEEDRARVLEGIRQRATPLLGSDMPIYGVASRAGLKAKQARDDAALRASGLAALEEWLEHFLVRESGFARLRAANETLLSQADEVKGQIDANLAQFELLDETQKSQLAAFKAELDAVQQGVSGWIGEVNEWVGAPYGLDKLTGDLGEALASRAQGLVPTMYEKDVTDSEYRHGRVRNLINPKLKALFDDRANNVKKLLVDEISSRRDALMRFTERWNVIRVATLDPGPASEEATQSSEPANHHLVVRVASSDGDQAICWPTGLNSELIDHQAAFDEAKKKFADTYDQRCNYLSARAAWANFMGNVSSDAIQGLRDRTREHVATAARSSCAVGDLDGAGKRYASNCVVAMRKFAARLSDEVAASIEQLKWQLDLSNAQLETKRAVGAERLRLAQSIALDIQQKAQARRHDLQRLAIAAPADPAYASLRPETA